MGRILAIDYGQKRTGIAVTDPLKLIANGLTTIRTHDIWTFLTDYLGKEEVESFVVGKPLQMNNQPSESMKFVTPFVAKLERKYPAIPILLIDERFTSKMAVQAMIEGGAKKKTRQNKALIDQISATILLQSYLEMQNKL